MRYGDFFYVCQTCGNVESCWLVTRDNRNVVIESECRKPKCACDEHTKGKDCRTKPCGGPLVLTFSLRPDIVKGAWCEQQVRANLSPILYFESEG